MFIICMRNPYQTIYAQSDGISSEKGPGYVAIHKHSGMTHIGGW
jgi:hypothetical protein